MAVKENKKYRDNVVRLLRRSYLDAENKGHESALKSALMKGYEYSSSGIQVMSITLGVDWMLDNYLNTWLNSSWRVFRASFKQELLRALNNNKLSQQDYDIYFNKLTDAKHWKKKNGAHHSELKTSSQRRKSISSAEFTKIIEYLKKGSKTYSEATMYWLSSSVQTGLRPSEWEDAELIKIDSAVVLKVINRKTSNGRGIGKTRELDITSYTTQDIEIIQSHLQLVKLWVESGNTFEKYYKGCAKTLYYACNRIWPNRSKKISLYTGRHQFTANIKSAGVSHKARAGMLGHKTTKTSSVHYATKKNSNSKFGIPKVDEELMDKLVSNPTKSRLDSIKEKQIRKQKLQQETGNKQGKL
ncbi:MAG: hypothetical protein HAW67_07845 [Endozoicomonadaceae bacterium]|nr:hypothetical protein [Endozoicomonadaceae bacterium]